MKPVTKPEDMHDICLKDFQEALISLITQEKWIPEDIFTNCISCIKQEAEKELHFFVSETTQMLTHNSNAKFLKQDKLETIVHSSVLMGILGECTCVNDTSCEKHKESATKSNVVSILSNTEPLKSSQLFPVTKSDRETLLYRNYQLNDRSLTDVLNTQSVQSEILELVSALANTRGGSIFLGVTNTAKPTVEGYRLTERDKKTMEQRISDILTGRNSGPVTIWGYPHIESTHYWKTFLHNVVSDDTMRKVIEIAVNKCPGGMFCDLPVCLDITDDGEIYKLEPFADWKKQFLHCATNSFNDEETDDYLKHFERKETASQDMPPDLKTLTTMPLWTSMVSTPSRHSKFFEILLVAL